MASNKQPVLHKNMDLLAGSFSAPEDFLDSFERQKNGTRYQCLGNRIATSCFHEVFHFNCWLNLFHTIKDTRTKVTQWGRVILPLFLALIWLSYRFPCWPAAFWRLSSLHRSFCAKFYLLHIVPPGYLCSYQDSTKKNSF